MNWMYLSSLKTIWIKFIYLIVLLFRKKVVFAASLYTTFSSSIISLLQFFTGQQSFSSFLSILWNEAGNKFLGAAPNLLQGLKSLNELNIIESFTSLWVAFASVYMLVFIWKLFRSKGMTSEVEWPELALVLLVWLLASSLVHGTSLFLGMADQLKVLLSNVSSALPEFSSNTSSVDLSNVSESSNLSESMKTNTTQ